MNQLGLLVQMGTAVVDKVNDRLTSYRLMLYFLLALLAWGFIGSFFHQVAYNWHEILISAAWLMAVCWSANKLIARYLDIPANKESDLITGAILGLILTPPTSVRDFALLASAGIGAMAVKYVITVYKSHIFNPAAAGAFIAGEVFHKYASWWVGTKFMAPLLILGGVLILRKMKRITLFSIFMAVYVLYLIFGTKLGGSTEFLQTEVLGTPVLFFAVVMLIEPLTTPSLPSRYIPYAIIVGLLYSITKLGVSPEEALLIGNLFTFLVATNRRYEMVFSRRLQEAAGIYSYQFAMPSGLKFTAGQYMEWTIAHNRTDSRGNRRYFTISSSPTEPGVMFTVKMPPERPSAFKQGLERLKPGDVVLASDLSGTFTLPKDTSKKVAFLAGGVGITPFRSMVRYLIDSKQTRDVALIYSATSEHEFSFKNVFDKATESGLRTFYETDRLDSAKISALLPDYKERRFYISGPYGFTHAMESSLLKIGVSPAEIVTDYFPGYGG